MLLKHRNVLAFYFNTQWENWQDYFDAQMGIGICLTEFSLKFRVRKELWELKLERLARAIRKSSRNSFF